MVVGTEGGPSWVWNKKFLKEEKKKQKKKQEDNMDDLKKERKRTGRVNGNVAPRTGPNYYEYKDTTNSHLTVNVCISSQLQTLWNPRMLCISSLLPFLKDGSLLTKPH